MVAAAQDTPESGDRDKEGPFINDDDDDDHLLVLEADCCLTSCKDCLVSKRCDNVVNCIVSKSNLMIQQ